MISSAVATGLLCLTLGFEPSGTSSASPSAERTSWWNRGRAESDSAGNSETGFRPFGWLKKLIPERTPAQRKSAHLLSRFRREPEPPSDSLIVARCRRRFFRDERLSDFSLRVDGERGVLRIRGHVSSDEQRSLAERLARDVQGVRDVLNQITVREQPPAWTQYTPVRLDPPAPTLDRDTANVAYWSPGPADRDEKRNLPTVRSYEEVAPSIGTREPSISLLSPTPATQSKVAPAVAEFEIPAPPATVDSRQGIAAILARHPAGNRLRFAVEGSKVTLRGSVPTFADLYAIIAELAEAPGVGVVDYDPADLRVEN